MDQVEMTPQMGEWAGEFGRVYTERNATSVAEMDEINRIRFGSTRTEINEKAIGHLDRSIRILEVGANIGNQLSCLQRMGFENLYAVELQWYAVEKAKKTTSKINIIQGSAFDLPFKDGYFDLVFTSGLLIHISPSDIKRALAEIHRCSASYIWGFEYFAEDYQEVNYRGHNSLLWKTDFAKLYVDTFPDLHLVAEQKYKYHDSDNLDTCFLLKK